MASKIFVNLSYLPRMGRVHISGLFSAESYRKINPECSFGPLRCLLHWVRHGCNEARFPGERALSIWLLPYVTNGDLSGKDARKVKQAAASGKLESVCRALQLNINELNYIEAYLRCSFEEAATYLPKTNGVFYLRAVHRALRCMPDIKDLRPCYERILTEFGNPAVRLAPEDLMKLRDIAFAAGVSWAEIAAYNKIIASLKPTNLRTGASSPSFPDSGYRLFLSMAEENALREESFSAVSLRAGALSIAPADPDAVILFLPDAPLLGASGRNETSIRKAFERIAEYLLNNGVAVIPLPAPFARDLSNAALPAFRAVSYHTYAHNRPEILHYKETSLRGIFFFDPCGYSGSSRLGRQDLSRYPINRSLVDQLRFKYQTSDMTKYRMRGGAAEEKETAIPTEKYVFVPLQVFDDSSQRWGSISSCELLRIVAEHYAGTNMKVIAKRHPYDRTAYSEDLIAQLAREGLVTPSEESVPKLLPGAEIIFTTNSGVGVEALLYGKPVISAGASEYQSCTFYCRTKEDVISAIEHVERGANRWRRPQADRFLSYLLEAASFPADAANGEDFETRGFSLLHKHLECVPEKRERFLDRTRAIK